MFKASHAGCPAFGLMTVSAMLPVSWEKRLVDINVRALTAADIKWADAIFVSAMHIQRDSLKEVIKLGKAYGKRVVVGGPYASICANELAEADHVFIGEAEMTLPTFLHDLERGEPKRLYSAGERPPLSVAPIPHFRLADLRLYSGMSVQYSRGCPFNCEFCDIIEIYGRVPRTKSNPQMLAEFDPLLKAGCRHDVFIVDDNFFA